MRVLSVDQKPSWFNNAGNTGTFAKKGGYTPTVRENHSKCRERYTILTSVPSFGHEDPNMVPKVAVLFKAAPDGSVIKKLEESAILKPWMKVQVQENGSYRSADVVEALEWILPDCASSEDSIVVILDWFSGHLTDGIAMCPKQGPRALVPRGRLHALHPDQRHSPPLLAEQNFDPAGGRDTDEGAPEIV